MNPFELITTTPAPLGSSLAVPGDLVEATRAYAAVAKAEGTRRAYRSAWRSFETWSEAHGLASLPAAPETVALFLADRANQGMTVATIEKQLAAISAAHRAGGFESPRGSAGLRAVVQGIRRSLGVAQAGKVPIGVVELRSAIEALPEGLLGTRDRALLSLGFAGAFRRSELVGLDVADISFVPEGMEVLIRRSKTDQEAKGRRVGIPFGGSALTCPVRAVQDWMSAGKIESGPLLRSVDRHGRVGSDRLGDRAVALSIKRAVAAIGLDPAVFGGHSLRSGFCTAAARAGKSAHAIQSQTGHRSLEVLHRYIRSATLFDGNAAYGIGL